MNEKSKIKAFIHFYIRFKRNPEPDISQGYISKMLLLFSSVLRLLITKYAYANIDHKNTKIIVWNSWNYL